MAKLLKLRGGTTSQHSSFTGASREVTVDTDKETLVVHDGSQAGGYPLARADGTGTANFSITGNFSVGGTVDGRDIATDGSKLDGIETNATADQTASEILTAIKTVDGTGTGLDADLLDGVEATSFLRSDSADIKTSGALTFNDSIQAQFGTGGDLIIQHTGSQANLDNNTGHFFIRNNVDDDDGGNIYIQAKGGENGIIVEDDSSVKLAFNNSIKLTTVTGGVDITGNLFATGAIGLDSTDYLQFTNGTRMDIVVNNSNEFRFESDGDFHADGDVIAFSTTVSDERLKTDIEKIENATDKISQINGYTFTYKEDGKKSAGVIAQELEKILPSAVSEKELLKKDDGVAYKTVHYDQIIGLLVESIKELKQEINELKGA